MADTKISDLDEATVLADDDLFVIAKEDDTNEKITALNLASELGGSGGLFDAYALLQDQKAANTAGGSFASGSWVTRVLNTEVFDTGGIVSLASDQFTLGAGTYFIQARAPCRGIDRNKAKIRNITDSTDDIIGKSAYTPQVGGGALATVDAVVTGRITIAGSKTFELQHQCETSEAGANGFGVPDNFGVIEIYSEVEIWREA